MLTYMAYRRYNAQLIKPIKGRTLSKRIYDENGWLFIPKNPISKAGGLFMDKAVEEYCFGCSKKRPCKITGTYRYEGETHKIYVCQWCRAATTKRQRSESAE